jgi:hypothetical protein
MILDDDATTTATATGWGQDEPEEAVQAGRGAACRGRQQVPTSRTVQENGATTPTVPILPEFCEEHPDDEATGGIFETSSWESIFCSSYCTS